jgi:predicted DNA-binding protein with PD1-like motif
MQKLIFILVFLILTVKVTAQETRKEVIKATTPFHDAKPNSDSIPKVYAIDGQFERVLIFRFKYKTDLLLGLDSMVKAYKIKNAVILSGIGAVRNYHYHTVSNRTFPSKNIFVKNPSAPADLVSMNGYIINGRIHAHMTLANPDKAFGGHLELGTEVFSFAILTLGILNDSMDLSRIDDKTYR